MLILQAARLDHLMTIDPAPRGDILKGAWIGAYRLQPGPGR